MVNKHDAVKQTHQFSNRFGRFRKLSGTNNYRNMLKGDKALSKQNLRKTNIFNEQARYAFHSALQDLKKKPLTTFLTVTVVTISLILLSICYVVYKNINQITLQYYPSPRIIVYLKKVLDDNAITQVVGQIQTEQGVKKVSYTSREEVLSEFCNWSGFSGAIDMLEENPFPAVIVVIPHLEFQRNDVLKILRDRINCIHGIDEVRMDDSWFFRLSRLNDLSAKALVIIGILILSSVFLVIGNTVRLSIFSHYDVINIHKLIGATDGFILRPFLYGGVLLSFFSASLSLILSEMLVSWLSSTVAEVGRVFWIKLDIKGLDVDECLLLLLSIPMIGWFATWLIAIQHLRHLPKNNRTYNSYL